MEDKEFNKIKRQLNLAYRDIFHSIPCIQDFACSREEYIAALQQAIETKKPIEDFLKKKGKPINKNALI